MQRLLRLSFCTPVIPHQPILSLQAFSLLGVTPYRLRMFILFLADFSGVDQEKDQGNLTKNEGKCQTAHVSERRTFELKEKEV